MTRELHSTTLSRSCVFLAACLATLTAELLAAAPVQAVSPFDDARPASQLTQVSTFPTDSVTIAHGQLIGALGRKIPLTLRLPHQPNNADHNKQDAKVKEKAKEEEKENPSTALPVVLIIHGWFYNKDYILERYAAQLTSAGIACCAFDLPDHGMRRRQDRRTFFDEQTLAAIPTLMHGIRSSVVDARTVLDYLETRSDIDHSRIAVLGYSLGGYVSTLLAGSDKRVSTLAVCATGTAQQFETAVTRPIIGAIIKPFLPTSQARKRPALPVLMQHGKRDAIVSGNDAQQLFDAFASPNKKLQWYKDSGHNLPVDADKQVCDWLARQLLAPDRDSGQNNPKRTSIAPGPEGENP